MKLALLLLLAATPAAAGELSDYAYAWPLAMDGTSSAWQLELPPEVHQVLTTPDLRDFEVFDAGGKAVPLARYEPPPARPGEKLLPLPAFAVGRRPGVRDVDALVVVERAPDGSLRRIEAGVAGAGAGPKVTDHLLDASKLEEPIAGLSLSWSAAPGDLRARYAVEASDDLEHWSVLVNAATVLALREGGESLERRRIPLPDTKARYLWLRALDDTDLGTLQVEAVIPTPAAPERRWIEARLVETRTDEGAYTYEVDGSHDVEAVRVVPQGDRSLAEIVVRSDVSKDEWLERARLTLVRLPDATRDEVEIFGGGRPRRWRLIATPPLDVAPRLVLGAHPDRFAFLPEGEGPWLLAAGSGTARREPAPVDAALSALGRTQAASWQPPVATLGERRMLSGEPALAKAKAPLPWERIALWSVLVAGAALVAALALRMLRQREPGPAE